jgi:hypothetical protein
VDVVKYATLVALKSEDQGVCLSICDTLQWFVVLINNLVDLTWLCTTTFIMLLGSTNSVSAPNSMMVDWASHCVQGVLMLKGVMENIL